MCRACFVYHHDGPPLNDAEALCTGSLLSVLAGRGAEVHVIAAEGAASHEGELAGEILDERVAVERVAARFRRWTKPKEAGAASSWQEPITVLVPLRSFLSAGKCMRKII